GRTYYWRVDEFDAANTYKGDVWSFTTRPAIAIVDPNLIGWWKLDEGSGTVALDWSGHENHATLVDGPQWVEGYFGGALEFSGTNYATMDPVADDIKDDDITLSGWVKTTDAHGLWLSCNTGGRGNVALWSIDNGQATMYDGSESAYEGYSNTVVSDGEWHMLTYVRSGPTGYIYVDGIMENTHAAGYSFSATDLWSLAMEWDSGGASDFLVGIVDDVRIYDTAMTADGVKQIMRGDLLAAWGPEPANNSTSDVVRGASVSWSAGDSASQHAVYFGTDRDAVAGAEASDTTGLFRGLQAGTSYTPSEGVEWSGGPYYWRVDEQNANGTVTRGNVWTFMVADYILVDDFESYNDIESGQPGSKLIYETWLDGFGVPTNGSTIGYTVAFQPTMETTIVRGGRQSAPMAYDNTTAAFSEVTLTMAAQDWTVHNIETLGLWFHGAAGNTGKLYVKVNDSKIVYDGDPADMQRAWQAWNIELASFGVNLQSVTSLAIGVEGAGATGTVLLDDIRLYALSRALITPVQPDAAALVGHWALEGNLEDSSGLGNHGTLNGNPAYALGKVGQAMSFDGSEDYLVIDGVADDITNNDITLAAWVNMPPEGIWYPVISCNTATGGNVGWLAVDASGGADFGSLTGTMFVTDNSWHHLAYTRIGDVGSLYVDGVLEGTHTVGFNFSTDNLWSVGQEWDGGPTASNFLIGTIDDVRIYDYGMSYAEVAGLAGRIMPFDKPF
ncbi:MAG: LamG domain-containing protein, partial [Planctomycetota bacterium]